MLEFAKELARVGTLAQPDARVTLMKRHDDDAAVYEEIEDYNKWMGSGASEISFNDDESITLMLRGERRTFFRPDTDPEMQQLMAKHQAEYAVALDVAMEQSKAIEKAQKEKATMTTKQDEVELTDEHIDVIANSVARHHGCSDHVAKQGVVFAVIPNGALGGIPEAPEHRARHPRC